MKRKGYTTTLSLIVVIFAIGLGWGWYKGTPKSAFRRHFDSIPSSVINIAVDGRTGLAGSDETLTFRISQSDLDNLLARRGFTDVTELIEKGSTRNEGAFIAHQERERAISYGVKPARYYAITKFDGLVYYVLITDAQSDLVYYHYYKT